MSNYDEALSRVTQYRVQEKLGQLTFENVAKQAYIEQLEQRVKQLEEQVAANGVPTTGETP